jgi:hypothetical protein
MSSWLKSGGPRRRQINAQLPPAPIRLEPITIPLKFALLFVCHNMETAQMCLNIHKDAYVLFVGRATNYPIHDRVILLRSLPNNIEHYPKLLTFTAWYAVIKNNLFLDYEHLCILEYDVNITEASMIAINNAIGNISPDIISFKRLGGGTQFFLDVNESILREFVGLRTDNTSYVASTWYPTTNHCMKRVLLSDFVDWYYPLCIPEILQKDYANTSWYHERLFSAFININNITPFLIGGVHHYQQYSHRNTVNKDRVTETNTIIYCKHNAGFFSCCSVRLHEIIAFFNTNKHIPSFVDSSAQFAWYKPPHMITQDITPQYFITDSDVSISYSNPVDFMHTDQYKLYGAIPYTNISPFIEKYFSLSDEIRDIISSLEQKYNIDYDNTCVMFYRGNDKITETDIGNYDGYIAEALRLQGERSMKFLIQSDETEFINTMTDICKENALVFRDEIRYMPKQNSTVDIVFKDDNNLFSKYYLAITVIMSRCKYIVCGTGNCSLWIMLYRKHARGVTQYKDGVWHKQT